MTDLLKKFDRFDINDDKLEDVNQSVVLLNDGLTRTLEEYTYSVVGKKEFAFEFNGEFKIESVFGCFKEVENVTTQ